MCLHEWAVDMYNVSLQPTTPPSPALLYWQVDQITLARADRGKDCQHLISYAIGCMMGRYSLDEPGVIYAHAGNAGFEPERYATFPADADGIVPITDELWFVDDAASSTAARNRMAKRIESLKEKHLELLAYDEKLRHYADRRITLDQDDGGRTVEVKGPRNA
jgi:hypothetical protein